MESKKCPICDCEIQAEEEITFCPQCTTDFTQAPPEQKLKEAHAGYTLGRRSTNAMLYLSNQRLIMIPEKLKGYGLSMALTAAVVNKMRKNCEVISIPFNQLDIRQAKQGLFGKILVVNMPSGEVLKINVPKQKEWLEAITHAMHNQ